VERTELPYMLLKRKKINVVLIMIHSSRASYRCVSEENVLKFGANVPVNPAFHRYLTREVVTQIKACTSERSYAATYYLQIREMAGIVAFQIAWSVITGSRRCKVPERTQGCANAAQSIEQIVDSLRFTRRKLYMLRVIQ
jgi:hypothetical protein